MEMRVLERDKNALKVSIETPDDTVEPPEARAPTRPPSKSRKPRPR